MNRAIALCCLAVLLMVAAAAQQPAEHVPRAGESATEPHASAEAGKHDTKAAEHGPSLDLWKWVNFAILAGILGWGLGKSAPAFFRSRTEEIQRGIADATRVRQEAEARAAKMEIRMASLQNEIEHLRSEARSEMAREGDRIRKETEAHLGRIQAHGEQEIRALTKHAEQNLRAYSAGLALKLAEERIRRRMTPAAQDALVDRFVHQMGSRAAGSEVRQ